MKFWKLVSAVIALIFSTSVHAAIIQYDFSGSLALHEGGGYPGITDATGQAFNFQGTAETLEWI